MDSSNWIGLLILLGMLFSFGYVRRSSRINDKKTDRLFDKLIKEKQLIITDRIDWYHGSIGIDEISKKVVIIHQVNRVLVQSSFFINELSNCRLIHDRSPKSTIIKLRFEMVDQLNIPVDFIFYNSTVDILGSVQESKEMAEVARKRILRAIQNYMNTTSQ